MVRGIYLVALIVGLISFASLPATAQSARTFYIDYATGSNTNPGTKSSPWKTHPYMQTAAACTGTGNAPAYTHAAGDQFIFKGGVTWPSACFRMYITAGGVSGDPDYYGVDQTWYAGGSWARPIFDGQNNVPANNTMITARAKWITFDNLEVARMKITAGVGECADANFDLGTSSSGNITVENSYIHDWTITALTAGSTSHGTGSICQNGASNINAVGNTISDLNTTAVVPFGACFRNLTNVENNDCEHTGEGEVGHFGKTDGNIFANINGAAVQAHDTVNHTNIIEASGASAGDGPIFNNVLHDNYAGVSIFDCNQANIYNNVIWNNVNNYAIELDSNCPGATSSTVANIYNNTVDCSSNSECFKIESRSSASVPGVLNLRNNQWIANSTAACYNNTGAGCGIIAGGTQSNNVTMSPATAASQGYSSSSFYQPTSSGDGTVGVGIGLANLCTSSLGSLCADRMGNPRLTSWDAGAYEFGGAQSSSKPNPPTNLTASVQ
jgi:hypothetical protein